MIAAHSVMDTWEFAAVAIVVVSVVSLVCIKLILWLDGKLR